jgi:hypothetical protein
MMLPYKRTCVFRGTQCRHPPSDDEQNETEADIDLPPEHHTNVQDLSVLIKIFLHCDGSDLLLAMMEHSEEAASLLDSTISSRVLIGFTEALGERELLALSEATALIAFLFRIDWIDHDRFVLAACPLLLQVLQWQAPDLEVWFDCLNVVCYALRTMEIADEEIMK